MIQDLFHSLFSKCMFHSSLGQWHVQMIIYNCECEQSDLYSKFFHCTFIVNEKFMKFISGNFYIYLFIFLIFQGLDEWDVFLDDKSRKDVETMLVEGAKKWSNQQFFFISPQNSAYNNPDMRKLNGDRVVIMDLEKSGDRVNNNR